MKRPKLPERVWLYVRIGAVYGGLSLFGDLVSEPATFPQRFINTLWLHLYLVGLNFGLFERTIPFLSGSWKRLFTLPFFFFGYLFLYSVGFYAWRALGINLRVYFQLIAHESVQEGIAYHMPYSLFSVLFFGVAKSVYDFRKLKTDARQLRLEKQQAELAFLKAQTNPHFLFNTLNNLYALAKDKSDLAPEAILRLSQLLRFMLYETSGQYIAIEQELKIIADYLALERLRYDDSLRVRFSHDLEDPKQALPPLLLMPLVENAFKHGVSETRREPFIDIHLAVRQRRLTFLVRNSTEPGAGERSFRENIGLSNLRRQLHLLYTDYDLTVRQEDAQFTASLTINLASHA
jgi:sensor histidine kinase YesM